MTDLSMIDGLNVNALQHAEAMNELHETLRNVIVNAQSSQACYYNRCHISTEFAIDEMMLLNGKNLQM